MKPKGDREWVEKHTKVIYAKDKLYKEIAKECKQAGITLPCPHCFVKYRGGITSQDVMWLDPSPAKNPVSRRNGEYICQVCAKTEFLADYLEFESDDMARTVVDQDRQEAMRLPPGTTWGVSRWPTGGLDEFFAEMERRYKARLEVRGDK